MCTPFRGNDPEHIGLRPFPIPSFPALFCEDTTYSWNTDYRCKPNADNIHETKCRVVYVCVCRRLRGYVSACVHTGVTPRTLGSPRRPRGVPGDPGESRGSPGRVPGESREFREYPGNPGEVPGETPGDLKKAPGSSRGVPGESPGVHREPRECPGEAPGDPKEAPGAPGETPRRFQGQPQSAPRGSQGVPEDTGEPRCMVFAILAKGPKGGPERNIAKHGVK